MSNRESAHVTQKRDPAGLHPFGNEDITIFVKAGVMGMNELPGRPAVGLSADLEAVKNLLGPFRVIAQMDDDLIVLVEQTDAGMQVRRVGDLYRTLITILDNREWLPDRLFQSETYP